MTPQLYRENLQIAPSLCVAWQGAFISDEIASVRPQDLKGEKRHSILPARAKSSLHLMGVLFYAASSRKCLSRSTALSTLPTEVSGSSLTIMTRSGIANFEMTPLPT
jgi:hypothetical protein